MVVHISKPVVCATRSNIECENVCVPLKLRYSKVGLSIEHLTLKLEDELSNINEILSWVNGGGRIGWI